MPHKRKSGWKKFRSGQVLVTAIRFADIPAGSAVVVEEVQEFRSKRVRAGNIHGVMATDRIPHHTRLRVNYLGKSYWSDPELYEEV
jgi:hypothetical protein